MPKRGQFPSHRVVDGLEYKWCGRCDRWRLLKFFYFSQAKQRHIHPCVECRAKEVNEEKGWILYRPTVEAWLRALVNRVGKAEAARLLDWHKSRITKYTKHPPRYVQRRTAKRILQAYRIVEANGVAISRNSIKHGAFERGKPVKFAEHDREFYNRDGDQGVENRRKARHVHRQTD